MDLKGYTYRHVLSGLSVRSEQVGQSIMREMGVARLKPLKL